MTKTTENTNKKKRNNRSNYKKSKSYSKNRSQDRKKTGSSQKKRAPKKQQNKSKAQTAPQPTMNQFNQKLSSYLKARSKFYNSYRGQFTKKLERIYKDYKQSLKNFWNYQNTLAKEERKKLSQELDFYPLDDQYSKAHPQDIQLIASKEKIDHIHLFHENDIQKSRSKFENDDETSEGNLEDYRLYKESL